MNQRTHVVIPRELVAEIDSLVGRRSRSRFLAAAAAQELKRLRQLKALRRAAGSWLEKDHPELRGGAARWVRAQRADR